MRGRRKRRYHGLLKKRDLVRLKAFPDLGPGEVRGFADEGKVVKVAWPKRRRQTFHNEEHLILEERP